MKENNSKYFTRAFLILLAFCLVIIFAATGSRIINSDSVLSKAEEVSEEETQEAKLQENETQVVNYTDDNETISISVIGKASKSVTPDIAEITAVIETMGSDMIKAKDDNFAIFEKVLAALEGEGFSRGEIILEGFNSYPSYDYHEGKKLTGYYCTTTFSFKVTNLDSIKQIIDKLTEAGVTSVRNVVYSLSNLEEVYSEVLVMAIDNAKAKVAKITGRDDLTLKCLREESVYSCTSLYKNYAEDMTGSMLGSVEIEARVEAEFC